MAVTNIVAALEEPLDGFASVRYITRSCVLLRHVTQITRFSVKKVVLQEIRKPLYHFSLFSSLV